MTDRTLLRLAEEQGWQIDAKTSPRRTEATLESASGETVARLTSHQGSSETNRILRVTFGEPDGAPSRFALRDDETTIQMVGAPGWTVLVATIPMTREDPRPEEIRGIERVLQTASSLASQELSSASSWRFDAATDRIVADRTSKLRTVGGSSVIAAIAAYGSIAFAPELLAFIGMLAGTGLGLGALTVLTVARFEQLAILRAHAQSEAIHGLLRRSESFDDIEPVAAFEPVWFGIAQNHGDRRLRGAAGLRGSRLTARSTANDLTLELRLEAVTWPSRVVPSSAVLPSSWATVELRGSDDVLAQVPPRLDEHRRPGSVRWQMGESELDADALSEFLTSLDRTLSGGLAGPYR